MGAADGGFQAGTGWAVRRGEVYAGSAGVWQGGCAQGAVPGPAGGGAGLGQSCGAPCDVFGFTRQLRGPEDQELGKQDTRGRQTHVTYRMLRAPSRTGWAAGAHNAERADWAELGRCRRQGRAGGGNKLAMRAPAP